MKKRIVTIFLVLVPLLISIMAFLYLNFFGDYIAIVGNKKVSKIEYNYFFSEAKKKIEKVAKITTEKDKKVFWESKYTNGEQNIILAKNGAFEMIKQLNIQLIKAREINISLNEVEKEKIEQHIDEKSKENGDTNKFELKVFNEYGFNLNGYRDIMQKLMLAQKFMEEEKKKIKIDQQEAGKFYDSNREKFDKFAVREIFFNKLYLDKNELLPEAQLIQIKNKAEVILNKIKNGENSADLAKEYTENLEIRKNEGLIIVDENTDLTYECKDWILTHSTGESELVTSALGYHVLKIEKRTVFNDVKTKVYDDLKTLKYQKLLDYWMNDPKYNLKKAGIFVNE